MAKRVSFDKIVDSYFSVVTSVEFTYKNKTYYPKPFKISPLLFRGFTCPENCAGCCPKFSLDYLPTEKHPYKLKKINILFNGNYITLFSDLQNDNKGNKCRNVDKKGRCTIHGIQPFSCDFELIRMLSFKDKQHPNIITQKMYGRGWNMLRSDGGRGALCELTPITEESIKEVIRKITRLKEWCEHFKLPNKCDLILEYSNTYLKTFNNKLI